MSRPFPADDRLVQLLPSHHRIRDLAQGGPLHALVRILADEAARVEEDLWQLHDDWFIETAADWAVPYIGALVGWRPVDEPPVGAGAAAAQRVLTPRREVAEALAWRRRKGTLALLEEVAAGVSGWPARAVEAYRGMAWTQHLDHRRPERGGLLDLRAQEPLARVGGAFDPAAHLVDVRRPQSARRPGLHNIQNVVLFLARLQAFGLERAPARLVEEAGRHAFAFSVLGNDAPLFIRPAPEPGPEHIAGKGNLPLPLRRAALAAEPRRWYGPRLSLAIWAPGWSGADKEGLVPVRAVVAADLRDWRYQPPDGRVAVDPERGRLAFPEHDPPPDGAVQVRWHYGFAAAIGGGPYRRPLAGRPAKATLRLTVAQGGTGADHPGVAQAIAAWRAMPNRPAEALVEILDDAEYVEPIRVALDAGEGLELRAAQGRRPLLRLLDRTAAGPDAAVVSGAAGSRLVLDGLLVAGRGLVVRGPGAKDAAAGRGDLCEVVVRDTTLVPGWDITSECKPRRPGRPSLELVNTRARLRIERSILGPVRVLADETLAEPVEISVEDSVVDSATEPKDTALAAAGGGSAFVRLTMRNATVLGDAEVHVAELVEDSIVTGRLCAARRQVGCVRFSWVGEGSRLPRRFHTQPEEAIAALAGEGGAPPSAEAARGELAHLRPRFIGLDYGLPDYARLADGTAPEIAEGASDGGEMGAFHDLFAPRRRTRLLARLAEHAPARVDLGLVFLT